MEYPCCINHFDNFLSILDLFDTQWLFPQCCGLRNSDDCYSFLWDHSQKGKSHACFVQASYLSCKDCLWHLFHPHLYYVWLNWLVQQKGSEFLSFPKIPYFGNRIIFLIRTDYPDHIKNQDFQEIPVPDQGLINTFRLRSRNWLRFFYQKLRFIYRDPLPGLQLNKFLKAIIFINMVLTALSMVLWFSILYFGIQVWQSSTQKSQDRDLPTVFSQRF